MLTRHGATRFKVLEDEVKVGAQAVRLLSLRLRWYRGIPLMIYGARSAKNLHDLRLVRLLMAYRLIRHYFPRSYRKPLP
ncbi:hypothetical protein KCP76_15955 [Salmonella enterica subsp. enterica serovar Weltevreden]|nr:hypothetical protein KCP76_15955 [Salmonella enterica subsp. enterica serovar Weltevreden]